MTSKRTERTGPRPVPRLLLIAGAAAAFAAAPVLSPAPAQAAEVAFARGQSVEDFYDSRADVPLWFANGQPNAAARSLLSLLSTASIDGLDPSSYRTADLAKALARAAQNPRAVRKADYLLSKAFVDYARDLRNSKSSEMKYVEPGIRTPIKSPRMLLDMAATAPSLDRFVSDLAWMNPLYAPLRKAMVSGDYSNSRERSLLRINLDRARVLPAGVPRSVIVNTATQRLYMYDGRKLTDSMKVVVGQERADRKTPMMAGWLRYASLNPYWNVPPDLVWDDIGVHVEDYGLGYLKSRGYQILSDWSENASLVDPETIDWDAVKDGSVEIRVRQLPGPRNVLGKVKYTFDNPFGVYLHDTSAKELLTRDTRLYSGGCIRLEDAGRFGEWLFGRELHATSDDPDIKVVLDTPVPVYVTYMTAVPDGSSITFLDDVYGWDAKRLAEMNGGGARDEILAAR